MSRLLAACAAVACLLPVVASANAIMICNTDQAAGCVATVADGATDPNYGLIAGSVLTGGTKAMAQDGHPIPDSWANDANSKWIVAFTVGSGFVAGLKTLDFVITNGDGPTGPRVDNIAGTAASFAAAIPEPASVLLLGSGGLALYRQRRRTRQ
jgi:hypothetical protein